MSDQLVVIPVFMRTDAEYEVTCNTLETLRDHEPSVEVYVIDDHSPDPELSEMLEEFADDLGMRYSLEPENEGFSRTVNHGIRTAKITGQDVILCNADIEFVRPFVDVMAQTVDSQDRPAAISGALLLYPSGMIQHAGVFFSFLNRAFDHRYRYAPGGLPEAQMRFVCPVTGALQFIRNSTIQTVGLYDEEFRMGFEDIDYCLRAFDAGLECIYDPRALAIHHESIFRGSRNERLDEWQQASLDLLHSKHGKTPLGQFVPPIT